MTADQYVKQITKGIQCDAKRRKDIRKQLKAEIQERLNKGEKLENIIESMGSVKEVVASFNETSSVVVHKSHAGKKLLKAIIPMILVLAIMMIPIILLLPKQTKISESEIFIQSEVDEAVVQVIDWLDRNDYESMRKIAREDMANVLTEEIMTPAKEKILIDWGKRVSMGKIYSVEITQKDKHFATCQVTAVYEKISVTYTMSFDEKMHLAGLYFK